MGAFKQIFYERQNKGSSSNNKKKKPELEMGNVNINGTEISYEEIRIISSIIDFIKDISSDESLWEVISDF